MDSGLEKRTTIEKDVVRRALTPFWTTLDQALVSLVSLGLVVIVARVATPTEFGAFGLVQATLIALSAAYRTTVGTLILTSLPQDHVSSKLAGLPWLMIFPAAVCLTIYLATGIHAFLGISGSIFFLVASTATISARFGAFRAGKVHLAWIFSLVNALGLVPASAFADRSWIHGLFAFGLTSSVLLALMHAWFAEKSLPVRSGWAELSLRRREVFHLLGSFLSIQTVALATPFILSTAAGLTAVASLRGGQMMMTAGTQVPQGLQPLVLSRSKHEYGQGALQLSAAFRRWVVALILSMTALAAALFLIPDEIGRLLLGDTWGLAEVLFVWLVLEAFAAQLAAGIDGQFRALDSTAVAARVRALFLLPMLLLVTVGSYLGSAAGAAFAMALAQALLVCGLSRRLRQVLRDRLCRQTGDGG